MFDNLSVFLTVLGMALVTFGVRFVLYARANHIRLVGWMEDALRFVPVAVLTALISPLVLVTQPSGGIAWHSPWLGGALAALVLGLAWQRPLFSIVGGIAVFVALKLYGA